MVIPTTSNQVPPALDFADSFSWHYTLGVPRQAEVAPHSPNQAWSTWRFMLRRWLAWSPPLGSSACELCHQPLQRAALDTFGAVVRDAVCRAAEGLPGFIGEWMVTMSFAVGTTPGGDPAWSEGRLCCPL